jgi:hypothetical protein
LVSWVPPPDLEQQCRLREAAGGGDPVVPDGADEKSRQQEADSQEEAYFLETLEANKQISRQPGALPPGATHQVERDESGNERVVRKRFSAL